jgi:hypothetical protein
MLSPAAARLGTFTRIKGKCLPWRPSSFGFRGTVLDPKTKFFLPRTLSNPSDSSKSCTRWKSCVASSLSLEEEDDASLPTSLGWAHVGHAQAAQVRAEQPVASANEAWRINLGRGTEATKWLGPRIASEWFTGVAPVDQKCPGTCFHCVEELFLLAMAFSQPLLLLLLFLY